MEFREFFGYSVCMYVPGLHYKIRTVNSLIHIYSINLSTKIMKLADNDKF